jgi:carbonic anhydrase
LLNESFAHLQGPDRLKQLSQINVILQMSHLHSHPAVETRVRKGGLGLHAWYYEIHTGIVEVFNEETGQFEEWE